MILDRHRRRVLSELGWAGIAGNAKAVRVVRRLVERARDTGDPLVLILSGPSGIGKSLTAQLAAQEYGCNVQWTLHTVASGECNKPTMRRVAHDFGFTPYMGKASGLLIEEVDTASADALGYLLTFLETLRAHRIVIMTTNCTEMEFWGLPHGAPIHRRAQWVHFSTEGLATSKGKPGPGAKLVKTVLESEGLDGGADSYYVRLVNEAHGNLGDAILAGERAALAAL